MGIIVRTPQYQGPKSSINNVIGALKSLSTTSLGKCQIQPINSDTYYLSAYGHRSQWSSISDQQRGAESTGMPAKSLTAKAILVENMRAPHDKTLIIYLIFH